MLKIGGISMANYTITCSCGHEETYKLLGKYSDRENRVEWLKTQACNSCRAEAKYGEANVRAKEESKNMGLRELVGSEKQVVWATTIRMEILTNLAKYEKLAHFTYDEFNTGRFNFLHEMAVILGVYDIFVKRVPTAKTALNEKESRAYIEMAQAYIKADVEFIKNLKYASTFIDWRSCSDNPISCLRLFERNATDKLKANLEAHYDEILNKYIN